MKLNWTAAVLAFALVLGTSGCISTNNARVEDILSGYQPEPRVDKNNVNLERRGENEFTISLQRAPEVEVLKNPSWSWAACVASLCNYTKPGLRVTQDDIIRAWAGHSSKQTAGQLNVLVALAPESAKSFLTAMADYESKPHSSGFMITADSNGNYYEAHLPAPPEPRCIVEELSLGRPVLVAIKSDGDAMNKVVLVTSVRFSLASTDGSQLRVPYYIHEMSILDPFDGLPASYKAEAKKSVFDRIMFATSAERASDYVRKATYAYQHAQLKNINSKR